MNYAPAIIEWWLTLGGSELYSSNYRMVANFGGSELYSSNYRMVANLGE